MNTQNLWKKIHNVVAPICFNVCKLMHHCTYDLIFFRYDLVVLRGRIDLIIVVCHLGMIHYNWRN